MPLELNGQTIETDEEGYLANRSDWSEDVAKEMARVDLAALIESLCEDLIELGQPVQASVEGPAPYMCRAPNIRRAIRNLIENAVHMPGNITVDQRKLGSWGDAAVISFNVDKPVGGILGGALITNRDDVYEAVSRQAIGASNGKECWNRVYTSFLAYHLKPLLLRMPGMAGGLLNTQNL